MPTVGGTEHMHSQLEGFFHESTRLVQLVSLPFEKIIFVILVNLPEMIHRILS